MVQGRAARGASDRLADPATSRAVLIGASSYDHPDLEDLPAVANNLTRLAGLLSTPDIWGLPDANCFVLGHDELAGLDAPIKVAQAVKNAAAAAVDTLLVYYAGHGLPDLNGDLHLAMPKSDPDLLISALSARSIQEIVKAAKNVQHKVIIFDCCYAARAVNGGMSRGVSAVGGGPIEGMYLLAAVEKAKKAWSVPGEEHTAFTGELIELLEHGIPDGPPILDMEVLHGRLHTALASKARPLPEQYNRATGTHIAIVRNRACRPAPMQLAKEIRDLLNAQIRAADAFPYRLAETRAGGLTATYVRQLVFAQEEEDPPPDAAAEQRNDSGKASTRSERETDRENAPLPLEDILHRHDHLIVTGGPGMGKSTMTLQLARELALSCVAPAEKTDTDAGSPIPLRIRATALAESDVPFNTLIVRSASAVLGPTLDERLSDRLLRAAPANTRWLLIVDGLDEIVDPTRRRAAIGALAARIAAGSAEMRLLITTRPLPRGELSLLTHASVGQYELEPFDKRRLEAFARRWFGENDESDGDAARFLTQIAEARLSSLVQAPLLAAIAASVYRSDHPLPSNRYELYEQYLSHLTQARAQDSARQWRALTATRGALSPTSAKSTSDLFAQRMAMARHVAERTVVAGDDPVDAAVSWADAHVGRSEGPPSAWRELVGNALEATNLFIRDAGSLEFVHLSFAEHLTATEAARRLPSHFDPQDPDWSATVIAAVDEDDDRYQRSLMTLTHHAHLNAGRNELYSWLEACAPDGRLLVGALLAAGAPADKDRMVSFCAFIEEAAREDSLNERIFTTAERIHDDSVAEILAKVAANRSVRDMDRVRAVRALWTLNSPRANDSALALIADTNVEAFWRADTAERLRQVGSEFAEAVSHTLQEIAESSSYALADRVLATSQLPETDPSIVERTASFYRSILSQPGVDSHTRRLAGENLATLGPSYQEEGAATLAESVLSATNWPNARSAARALNSLGGRYRGAAIEALRTRINTQRFAIVDLSQSVRTLVEIDADQIEWTSELLASIAAQTGVSVDDRVKIAELLAELDPAAAPASGEILKAIAENALANPLNRSDSAEVLAKLGPPYVVVAAETLRQVAITPGSDAWDRQNAASALGKLGKEYTPLAADALHTITDSIDSPLRDRLRACETWAKLTPYRMPEIADCLRRILYAPGADHSSVIDTAQTLADLGTMYAEEAANVICEIVEDKQKPPSVRVQAAEGLKDWSHSHTRLAPPLRSLLTTPTVEISTKVRAAKTLASLNSTLRAEAAGHLVELIQNSMTDLEDRIDLASALGEIDNAYAHIAARELRKIIADRGATPMDRKSALKELMDLSPDSLDEVLDRYASPSKYENPVR